jgi:chromosome segregation ATPase
MDNLIVQGGTFIGAILFTVISLSFTQRKNARIQSERSQTLAHVSATNQARLEERIADQQVLIDDLKKDVSRLTHIEGQYNLLQEAHDLLKKDHDELKGKFEEKSQAWEKANGDLVTERTKISDLETQNAQLFEANKTLSLKMTAYERVFELQGQRLNEKTTDVAPEPGEAPAPVVEEPKV